MGIKKLGPYLRKQKIGVRETTLATYGGQRLCIDVPILMYRFKATTQDVVQCFEEQYNRFVANQITPIYVFDGRPPKCKDHELKKRQQVKTNMKKKAEDTTLPIFERILASERVASIPLSADYKALKQWLDERGARWLVANGDAEKACSMLTIQGKADAVLSEDFDTLAYGGKKLITGFSLFSDVLVEYDLATIQATLNFDHAQFVDFCILCGSDLCLKIRNVGPAKARKFIAAHRNIEQTVQFLDQKKYQVPEDFDYVAARAEFLHQ